MVMYGCFFLSTMYCRSLQLEQLQLSATYAFCSYEFIILQDFLFQNLLCIFLRNILSEQNKLEKNVVVQKIFSFKEFFSTITILNFSGRQLLCRTTFLTFRKM